MLHVLCCVVVLTLLCYVYACWGWGGEDGQSWAYVSFSLVLKWRLNEGFMSWVRLEVNITTVIGGCKTKCCAYLQQESDLKNIFVHEFVWDPLVVDDPSRIFGNALMCVLEKKFVHVFFGVFFVCKYDENFIKHIIIL